MRCKKHPVDDSSIVGVCASCLRERLFALIVAQEEAQARARAQAEAHEDRRKSDTNPPPLLFPRSVSPYICRRKSDTATVATATWHHHHHDGGNLSLPNQKFFSTPQVGPTGAVDPNHHRKKKSGKFSLLANLFRSKPGKPGADSNPRVSDFRDTGTLTTTSSPSWFSTILHNRRRKQTRTFSLDESAIRAQRKTCRNRDRGMSPEMFSEDEEDTEQCRAGSSGYSSESSQGWKQTPRRTPAAGAGRLGAGRSIHNRNVSGIALCLSPLVRASPNRLWSQKGGVPTEVVVPGDIRAPVKPHLSTAASFCKNRSRKLADFGRSIRNH